MLAIYHRYKQNIAIFDCNLIKDELIEHGTDCYGINVVWRHRNSYIILAFARQTIASVSLYLPNIYTIKTLYFSPPLYCLLQALFSLLNLVFLFVCLFFIEHISCDYLILLDFLALFILLKVSGLFKTQTSK